MKVWELQKDFKLQPEPSRLVGGIDFVLLLLFCLFVLSLIFHGGICQNTRCHNPSTM